jgi:hypothetical protein
MNDFNTNEGYNLRISLIPTEVVLQNFNSLAYYLDTNFLHEIGIFKKMPQNYHKTTVSVHCISGSISKLVEFHSVMIHNHSIANTYRTAGHLTMSKHRYSSIYMTIASPPQVTECELNLMTETHCNFQTTLDHQNLRFVLVNNCPSSQISFISSEV